MNTSRTLGGGVRRPLLATSAALIAVSAYGGAAALLAGVIDLGAVIEARLPFGSTVFAGIALALVVAVPMTVAAHRAATGAAHAAGAAMTAGVLLVGWILVELAVIRTFSWLQPVLAAAGVAVLLGGLWPRLRRPAG
jgi:hypothetical protein